MYRMWERWRGRVGEREWPRWLKNLQVPDIDNGDKDIQKGGTMERRRGKERRRRKRDMLYCTIYIRQHTEYPCKLKIRS